MPISTHRRLRATTKPYRLPIRPHVAPVAPVALLTAPRGRYFMAHAACNFRPDFRPDFRPFWAVLGLCFGACAGPISGRAQRCEQLYTQGTNWENAVFFQEIQVPARIRSRYHGQKSGDAGSDNGAGFGASTAHISPHIHTFVYTCVSWKIHGNGDRHEPTSSHNRNCQQGSLRDWH